MGGSKSGGVALERSFGYGREDVEARAEGEPDWLASRRREAWDVFETTPLPTTRSEEWRYTDPKLLRWNSVRLAEAGIVAEPAGPALLLADREAAARVVQVGAAPPLIELDPELAAQGVILADLADAASEHADLVREHLATLAAPPAAGKFAALNAALWAGGVFLHVPRGVRIDRPIRVVRWIEEAGLGYFPRTLIVAGEGSQFAFVEEFASPDFDEPAFSCGAVEVYAKTAARVQYVALQRWGRGVRHLATQRTVAGRDARLDSFVVNLGADVARIDLAASLEGPGARSELLGLYFARDTQHFDHETRQNHKVPHASSDLLYKGGLDGESRAVFRGLIKVFPKAQRTDAYQTNRNLLLSRTAQATSLPNLEIEADDVRCSHAATVGHLDDEELFYIMSRGIARRDAERLVVFGFFGEVLERLALPDLVRELRAAIEQKIG
jgi:Fe-S cluster assembly protein SufD